MQFLNPVYIIAILIAIAVHECSHALASHLLGDDTAKWEGRLTLNPLSHLDLIGALLFITVGFGWAKPVPVNPVNLKHPRRDTALIALAGPVSNLLLGFLCFLLLQFFFGDRPSSFNELLGGVGMMSAGKELLQSLLLSSLMVNLGLMAFNLLPVPPLDGSNILRTFIPWRYETAYMVWMQRTPIALFAVLLLESFTNIHILSGFIMWIVGLALSLFSFV